MTTAFTLRPWYIDDLPHLVHYANNQNIARFLTDQFPHPYTQADGQAFIAMANRDHPARILAIEIDGHAAGGIGIHPQSDIHRLNAELGYWLGEPYWGKGVITSAIAQMIHFAFANLDVQRIFARPFGSNLASQKVLEKNGFVLEARIPKVLIKNGSLEDELIYGIRRSQWAR
ncbi:MAG: GNAT family protein [Chitinophagales bacterium]